MNALLEIALHDESDNNILRALFTESQLGDHMMSYVASGFKVALFGISSHVWAVSICTTKCYY